MLAGYLAAGFSKTGKIGTYGGLPFAGVTLFMDGLYAGIKYYNQKNGTTVTLLGWDGDPDRFAFVGGNNPWNDPARASSSPRPSSTRVPTSSTRSRAARATARSRR